MKLHIYLPRWWELRVQIHTKRQHHQSGIWLGKNLGFNTDNGEVWKGLALVGWRFISTWYEYPADNY